MALTDQLPPTSSYPKKKKKNSNIPTDQLRLATLKTAKKNNPNDPTDQSPLMSLTPGATLRNDHITADNSARRRKQWSSPEHEMRTCPSTFGKQCDISAATGRCRRNCEENQGRTPQAYGPATVGARCQRDPDCNTPTLCTQCGQMLPGDHEDDTVN